MNTLEILFINFETGKIQTQKIVAMPIHILKQMSLFSRACLIFFVKIFVYSN